MKHLIYYILISLSLITVACKKDVPEPKKEYIGEWISSDGSTTVIISSNGAGSYIYDDGSMTKNINGKVKFTSSGFVIKTLGVLKKEFSVSKEPTLITSTNNEYEAIFNNETYYRQ